MPAQLLDGNALARDSRARIARRVREVLARGGRARLDAVLVDSGDGGARVYAHNQGKSCEQLGIEYVLHELPRGASFDDIAGRILLLNTKDDVSAIMVHLPLPAEVDPFSIQRLIDPDKDAEGVNPANIGNVVYGHSSLIPCTSLAVITMLASTGLVLRGKLAVVVGAGDVVGKPIAVLLMRQEATVISCNKWTPGLPDLARRADVLIAAAGVPGLVTADWIKPGAAVIDVGVSRVVGADGKSRTVGDVDFSAAREIAGWISPVPGGVGPMTVAMLLHNVAEAASRRVGLPAL